MTTYCSYSMEEATKVFRLPADRDVRKTKTIVVSLEDKANAKAEAQTKKEQLRRYFHETYELYEQVFAPVNSDEGFLVPPVHKLRHPLIFYLGHTATFYLNKLALAGLMSRINHKYEESFAIGVDEMSWDDLNEAHYDWPAVADVWQYRRTLRENIDKLFDVHEMPLPLTFDNSQDDAAHAFYWAVLMGAEHERIHIETASVHVRELPMKYIRRDPFWDPCTEDATDVPAENPMVAFPGATVKLGRDLDSEIYGWDCDYATSLTIDVKPFAASERLISNADFFEFVKDGGYQNQELWDEEGWNWVSWKKPQHPWFWTKGTDGEYKYRHQCTETAIPWSWPAEVNNLEAAAYAKWLGKKHGKTYRLPTEAEWMHMRDECMGSLDQHQWKVAPGNVNLEHYSSCCPVNKFKIGKLYDVIGNVWQHTETPVYPYKGFKVHPLYDDFSMPTFDGRHFCMKGGTWISTGNEATRDARFAFRRHFFQYIGIRLVEGAPVDESVHCKNVLGLDPPVDLAAHRSYSELSADSGVTEAYGKTLADLAVEAFKAHGKTANGAVRAMDLLCGAGRASYEISLAFKQVIGVDFSARMLQPAFAMRERGMAPYSAIVNEATGERVALTAFAEGKPWSNRREDVTFYQSDPANLHAHLTGFDLILAFNIQDQNTSYNPAAVPPHLVSRLNPGGVIFAAEPVTKQSSNALSTEQYMATLTAAGMEIVAAPTVVKLYIPDTVNTGKTVDFAVFAARHTA